TLPNTPTVVTKAASSIGQITATLNASVNPNEGTVSDCKLEYGTSTSYTSSATCSPSPGSGTGAVAGSGAAVGLKANTLYHFRVVATNEGGKSEGTDQTFETLPNTPTVVTKAASSIGQITATLNASVNPNEGTVSDCKLEYGTSTSYTSSATCSPSPGSGTGAVAVSGAAVGLKANTLYHFRVVATNEGGKSEGTDQTFETLPNTPTVVTKAASSIGQITATLNASVNPNEGTVSDCKLEYGTSTSYTSSATCSPSPGSGTGAVAVSGAAVGLKANTLYHFRVVATNEGGKSEGTDQTFETLPNTPTVVTKAASSIGQITATLNASVNPNEGTVSDCKLEYGTSTSYTSSATCSPSPGSGTGAVAVSGAAVGLKANTLYHFRVVATNEGGKSEGTDQTFETLPNTPTVVTKAASSIGQITATLNASVNPNEGTVSDCKLEYGTSTSYTSSATCSPSPGSGTGAVAVSGAAVGLKANTLYHFRVVATNEGGKSEGTDQTFETLPNTPTVVTKAASSIGQITATLNASVNP